MHSVEEVLGQAWIRKPFWMRCIYNIIYGKITYLGVDPLPGAVGPLHHVAVEVDRHSELRPSLHTYTLHIQHIRYNIPNKLWIQLQWIRIRIRNFNPIWIRMSTHNLDKDHIIWYNNKIFLRTCLLQSFLKPIQHKKLS